MSQSSGDDDGMRIVRGKGKRARLKAVPSVLIEAAPGSVVYVAVRVSAHLAGPRGDYDFTLCRLYDVAGGQELYRCGDLCVSRSDLVALYEPEEK
jgi:hypothetical protein